MFDDTKIKVELSETNDNEKIIWVEENEKRFRIEDSSSGYSAILYILYKILDNTDRVIFLDEPELHFHPAKIRQIGQELLHLTKESRNQIIIISHSPKFVDVALQNPDNSLALIVVRKNKAASLVSQTTLSDIKLKLHLVKSDVFFGHAAFLVEGPSDEAVIKAISDNFDGFFDRYGITIVNCGGVKSMNLFIRFLGNWSLPCYGLADNEYKKQDDICSVVKLDDDIEAELRKIIPKLNNKLKPEEAYDIIIGLLSNKRGFEQLKKTKIWDSIKNVISKQKMGEQIFRKKYESI